MQVFNVTKQYSTGFTLVELMVALAIVGIIATVGLPNLGAFFSNNRVEAAVKVFAMDLRAARDYARTSNITVCVIANEVGDYSTGWMIQEFDGRCDDAASSAGTILSIREAPAAGSTIATTNFTQQAPIGFSANTGAAERTGTLTIRNSDCTGNRNADIEILISGQLITREQPC